jgi:hypothetical protein
MACRSQLRNGSTKPCRRRGGRLKFTYGSRQQRTLDGSRPSSQYRDCKICKVKQYNADKSESQKKKIPHRGLFDAPANRGQCSIWWPSLSNAPLPGTSDSTTLQLSVYPSRIWQIKCQIAKFQIPFIPRTNARQTTTPAPLIANPRAPRVDAMNLFKDLSSKLAHPTSLRRELDKRMQLFQEGQKTNSYRTRGIQLLLD